jgi:hypothetical protein
MTLYVPFATAAHRIILAITTLALALAAVLTGALTAPPAGATTTEDSLTARLNGARSAVVMLRLRMFGVRILRLCMVRMLGRQRRPGAQRKAHHHHSRIEQPLHDPCSVTCTARIMPASMWYSRWQWYAQWPSASARTR